MFLYALDRHGEEVIVHGETEGCHEVPEDESYEKEDLKGDSRGKVKI